MPLDENFMLGYASRHAPALYQQKMQELHAQRAAEAARQQQMLREQQLLQRSPSLMKSLRGSAVSDRNASMIEVLGALVNSPYEEDQKLVAKMIEQQNSGVMANDKPTSLQKNVEALYGYNPSINRAYVMERALTRPNVQIGDGEKPVPASLAGNVFDPILNTPIDIPLDGSMNQFKTQHPNAVIRPQKPEVKLVNPDATNTRNYLENTETLAMVDKAIRLLKKDPDAVGLKNLPYKVPLGEKVVQELWPEHVPTTIAISKLGSRERHELSGANIPPSENVPLKPHVLDISDNYVTTMNKLTDMKQDLVNKQKGFENYFTKDNGFRPLVFTPNNADPNDELEKELATMSSKDIVDIDINGDRYLIDKMTARAVEVGAKIKYWDGDKQVDSDGSPLTSLGTSGKTEEQKGSGKKVVKQKLDKSNNRVVNVYDDGSMEYEDGKN